MASRLARKVKRAGKTAVQFRFSSTFEYIDLEFKGTWRPGNLRVIWLRNHRRVQTNNIEWKATADRGPNGAQGRAVFDPPFTVALLVTLYRESKKVKFDAKEYKYFIENEDANGGGKKILASITIDLAEYAGMPSAQHPLELSCKSVSKKVKEAVIGATIQSEFVKQGDANDDDMQSTYSAMSAGQGSLIFDEEDDDDLDEAATMNQTNASSPGKAPSTNPTEAATTCASKQNGADTPVTTTSPKQLPVTNGENEMDGLTSIQFPTDMMLLEPAQPVNTVDGAESPIHSPPNSPTSTNPIITTESSFSNANSSQQTVCRPEGEEDKLVNDKQEETKKKNESIVNEEMVDFNEKSSIAAAEQQDSDSKRKESTDIIQQPSDTSEVFSTSDKMMSSDRCPSKHAEQEDDEKRSNDNKMKEVHAQSQTQSQTRQNPEPKLEPSKPKTTPQPKAHTQTQPELQTQSHPEPHSKTQSKHVQQQQPHYDFAFEMAVMLAESSTSPNSSHSNQHHSDGPKAMSLNPFDEPKNTSSNPFDDSCGMEHEEIAVVTVKDTWLPGLELVDRYEAPVPLERVDKACVIALYFAAQWCPPCHKFLPKLIRFYNIMKENNRAFEVIYVSNDNTRSEAFKYMQEQNMAWPAIPYGHALIDKLKEDYKVKTIPLVAIVSCTNGEQIEESGKKAIEGASSHSSAMKLFGKWLERTGMSPEEEAEREKTGFIHAVKKAFSTSPDSSPPAGVNETRRKSSSKSSDLEEQKSKPNKVNHSALLQEKEERIRYLEEVNSALEQSNKDLNDESAELRAKIQDLERQLQTLQQSAQLLEEKQERLKTQTELRGWLYKRGVKGPTANVWRRRYFRLDQGNKLYYYKSASEGTPQGHIDLTKVVSVSEVSPAQQDKNHATFHVLVEGRTFQVQAHDEPSMRKWMEAIEYLKDFYQKKATTS